MLGRLARFELPALKVGHSVRYDVHANWKLVFQNYSECLHCPMIHPELSTVLPYKSGANDLIEGPFLGGYMEIERRTRARRSPGARAAGCVSDHLAGDDAKRAYYYTLMPNMMLSIHPDYVNYYLLTPVAVDHTIVESEWMFNPANEGDPEVQSAGRDRVLGRDQPPGLGHLRAEPARHLLAALSSPARTRRARAFPRRGTPSTCE